MEILYLPDSLAPQVLKAGIEKSDIYCSGRFMGGISQSHWVDCAFGSRAKGDLSSQRSKSERPEKRRMDANSQFRKIIQEMRAEISKLKKENQFLRMTLTSSSLRTSGGPCRESGDQREEEVTDPGDLGKTSEKSPATLYSGVSTDAAPAGHEHQGTEWPCLFWAVPTFAKVS